MENEVDPKCLFSGNVYPNISDHGAGSMNASSTPPPYLPPLTH